MFRRKGKDKKQDLDWMAWQIDKDQLNDPPMANLIRAIQYYNEKFGSVPNRCEVGKDWDKNFEAPQGMEFTRSRSVQKGHIMLALDPELRTTLPGKPKPE